MFKLGFHSMIAAIVYSCCTAAMAGSLTPPVGPPAPTMRTLDEVDTAIIIKRVPFTISSPGTYKLIGNLGSVSSGITIQASDVTLDLNGYSLKGISGATSGIVVAADSRNVTIKNGTCSGWYQGIRNQNPIGVDMVDLRVSGCTEFGIELIGGTITRCVIEGNGGAGIVASPSAASPFTCINSECRDNGSDGLRLNAAPSGTVVVDVQSSKFTGNGTTGAGSGIYARVSDVTSMVTWSSSNVVCSNNTINGTTLDCGTFSSFSCKITDCVNSSNGGKGFALVGGSGGGGQGGGSINGPLDISVSRMTCSSNGGDGYSFVTAPGSSGSSSVSIEDSVCCFNNDGGIEHEDSWEKSSVRIIRTRCCNNASVGCRVVTGDLDCDGCDFSRNGAVGSTVAGAVFQCTQTCQPRACSFVGNTGIGCDVTALNFAGQDMLCSSNGGHGVQISSGGADCNDFTCVDNGGSGIRFNGHVTVLKARASLSDSTCCSNALDGIDLDGVAFNWKATGTYSDGNTASGLRVRGWDNTTKGSITIDDDCSFSHNGENGIQIDACNSSVMCSSVRCNNNSGSGFLRKGWEGYDGTIKGKSGFNDCDFSFNLASGAIIEGGGVDQDCDGVTFSNNGGAGLQIGKGASGSVRGTVTIVKACFNSNQTGLDLACLSGAIISHCQADKNTGSGMVLSGSGLNVSNNRACNNTVNGISLASGTRGLICDNVCISNPTGIFIADTGNSVSRNSSAGCPIPISAPPDTDLAPSSPAATATSPFTNITF